MNEWKALAGALNRTMVVHAPGWTERNDADPGITVLELMAFLAESPLFNRETVERGSEAVARVLGALERARSIPLEASVAAGESWSGMKRPNYFEGKAVGVDDFTREQDYFLEKHRLHLRTLHGTGVVHGLQVSAGPQAADFTITPGLAIDGKGREVQLNEDLTFTIPANTASPVCVVLQYAERPVDPVAVVEGDDTTNSSRIEEGCKVVLSDATNDGDVTLARLISQQDAWRIDALFVPARAR